MELRAKPIEQAIRAEVEHGESRMIEYQPGDGSRYVLVFTDLTNLAPKLLGAQDRSVLVTLANFPHGPSMVVAKNMGFLAPRYVQEKLGVGQATAITLAEIIARFTGRDALTPEEYLEQQERSVP